AFQADFQTIEKELQEYIRRDALPTQLAPSDRQAGSYANQQAEPLTEAEALFYLGDLLLHINRTGDAEAYFGRAIALEPDLVTVQGALGMLRVRQNRLAEAKRHLQRAARSPNYLVHFYYAYVLSQEEAGGNQSAREYTPEKAAAIRAALKKSLDLAPDYADSHVRSQAQAMLAQFTSGEEAAPASDAALSKPDSGQSYVWERPPSTDSSNPVSSNNTAGGERIRGLLTRIVCAGAGTTLFVKVGERMLKLRGASLDRINFSSQVSTVKEISCGVRRPAVPVEVAYRPTHDLRGQFVGEVLTVEFVP
nr:tetratricopeptide repeat protein [Pyrinomonadaceae bacterium]